MYLFADIAKYDYQWTHTQKKKWMNIDDIKIIYR